MQTLAALLLQGAGALAADVDLQLQQVQAADWQARDIAVRIESTDRHNHLSLKIAELVIDEPALEGQLELSCALPIGQDASRCDDGSIRLTVKTGSGLLPAKLPQQLSLQGSLAWQLQADRSLIRLTAIPLADGQAEIEGTLTEQGWQLTLTTLEQALAPLLNLITPAWSLPSPAADLNGTASLAMTAVSKLGEALQITAQASVDDTSFTGSSSAAENLSLNWQLAASQHSGDWKFKLEQSQRSGGLYLELPLTIAGLAPGFTLTADQGALSSQLQGWWHTGEQGLKLQFNYRHPQVVAASGEAELDLTGASRLRGLQLELTSTQLQLLYEVYLQPLLLTTVWDDLDTRGSLSAQLTMSNSALQSLQVSASGVSLRDRQQRFFLQGVDLFLPIGGPAGATQGHLNWDAAGLYKLDVGAAGLQFVSAGRDLSLSEPAAVPLLDGRLQLDSLQWRDIGGPKMRFSADSILTPIDLKRLCEALGWPPMSGKLSGVIPGLNYAEGKLSVDGTLLARAFDGRAVIRNLSIDRLFSPVPELLADIEFDDIDLEQLTDTLAFGRITGRLQGYVRDLRLEAWQPVRLDAWFSNPDDDDSRHRISQRAIDNLSRIGGGVQASALTRSMLGVFSDFGYDRIGIGCTLSAGICRMRGLEPEAEKFIILKHSLLPPWVEIVGHNRAVDWPILLDRLRGIASGARPEIRPGGLLQ